MRHTQPEAANPVPNLSQRPSRTACRSDSGSDKPQPPRGARRRDAPSRCRGEPCPCPGPAAPPPRQPRAGNAPPEQLLCRSTGRSPPLGRASGRRPDGKSFTRSPCACKRHLGERMLNQLCHLLTPAAPTPAPPAAARRVPAQSEGRGAPGDAGGAGSQAQRQPSPRTRARASPRATHQRALGGQG